MNNNNRSIVEKDELKRLTNRCIGILLNDMDSGLNNTQISLIKKTIRQFESNIRKYILNEEHSHDATTQINQ